LDSGAVIKDALTMTTSLRGCMNFDLKAEVATNNMHSGVSGGVCPNPFHILTAILSKICHPWT